MTDDRTTADEVPESAVINTYVPHAPRIWNHWLGGKDNFAVDREVGDRIAAMYPDIVRLARVDRAFLGRGVRHLVEEEGIRQFLDVGTGLPTAENTHHVAQALAPESRVVSCTRWRPDAAGTDEQEVDEFCGVARKPGDDKTRHA
jgi:hypothetical protein